MENYKITDSELNSGVIAAPDTLVDTPQNNKMVFDRLPKLIATKFNGFVDSVIAKFSGYYTKEEVDGKETALAESIDTKADAESVYTKAETYTKNEVDTKETALGKRIDTKANSADVYVKTETYTKAETDKAIADKMVEAGAGDMTKAVYDTNGNGVVDKAETAENAQYAENGIAVYYHTAGTLAGSGTNGKFKATATGTYTSFEIDGKNYMVKAGSETEIELTNGVWYSFILDAEAKTINFKAGGAGLNFKIVGGTEQPTSPKENTIWVNTDTAIGEYHFSATEPTTRSDGTALQNGDLWIKVGILSTAKINVLKKNAVYVYPLLAKQYIDGVWLSKIATSYQNGEWVDWLMYLYRYGDSFEEITGGWYSEKGKGLTSGNAGIPREISITTNTNNVVFSCADGWYAVGRVWLLRKIDLTDINTITAIGTNTNKNVIELVVWSSIGDYIQDSKVASASLSNEETVLSVESLKGEYYVGFYFNTGQNTGTATYTLRELYCE